MKRRRCFTDPHYWKNPALKRAREKLPAVFSNRGVSIRRKGLYGQSGSKQRTHMYKQVCGMADDQSIALEIETKEPV